jgi:hypothetical protein
MPGSRKPDHPSGDVTQFSDFLSSSPRYMHMEFLSGVRETCLIQQDGEKSDLGGKVCKCMLPMLLLSYSAQELEAKG